MAQPAVPPEHGYYPHRERPFAILIESLATKAWNRFVEPSEIGLLPKGYDKNIHGPYVPWRYYGKPDTAFKDVKLGEFVSWFRRRNKRPKAIVQAVSRNYWYWVHRHVDCRYPNMAWVWQFCLAFAFTMYWVRYQPLHSVHTTARYH